MFTLHVVAPGPLGIACVSLALCALPGSHAAAAQFDIHGPAGSLAFGTSVTVLPNGNLVITDPTAKISSGGDEVGAVYLYDSQGNQISALTGSVFEDLSGARIFVLPSGNFVVTSDAWSNGAAKAVGAVTWVSGTAGLSGEVSSLNSLVGTHTNDFVGMGGVVVLANGNFLVVSPEWNGTRGAVTWVNGETGFSGEVSPINSLIGTAPGDYVGINYVGNIVALANGNYVVGSPQWSGSDVEAGAATWGDGSRGVSGEISASNSLVGALAYDNVGFSIAALTNGNYVVASPGWSNGTALHVGAATWADGASGIVGTISAGNSLTGSTANDQVASGENAGLANQSIVPLTNGNYVVRSAHWNNGGVTEAGAATWGDGSKALIGLVSPSNSLVGSSPHDLVSYGGVAALANGNYVVQSPLWNTPGVSQAGAATWANGATGLVGAVAGANSLIGDSQHLNIGSVVTPLTNGNYVVGRSLIAYRLSPGGSVTWANGNVGITGAVAAANSLLSTDATNAVGYVSALANGNYVIVSPDWGNGRGAVTWGNGTLPIAGAISAQNSFVGANTDKIGGDGVYAFSDGSYAIVSAMSDNSGAVTYSRGTHALLDSPNNANSILGSGNFPSLAYDRVRERLIVGRPAENIVTVRDVDQLFSDGFER